MTELLYLLVRGISNRIGRHFASFSMEFDQLVGSLTGLDRHMLLESVSSFRQQARVIFFV